MEAEGFSVYETEWWHYDYKDWRKYPILNKSFEELAIALRVRGNGRVHDREAVLRQLDDDAAPIVGIREPADVATAFEAIDPARHARGREHEAPAQARR